MRNITISGILGNSYPSSWNLNLRCNLTDLEIELLERLMSSLNWVHLSFSTTNSRVWSLFFIGSFLLKSFFMVLSKPYNQIQFLSTNFVWKSKARSKVKAFVWLVVHKKVNTNDMLHVRRPYKSLSPHWCILCKESGESIDHLFLHCPITLGLWH